MINPKQFKMKSYPVPIAFQDLYKNVHDFDSRQVSEQKSKLETLPIKSNFYGKFYCMYYWEKHFFSYY